jgi:hypothetical protein
MLVVVLMMLVVVVVLAVAASLFLQTTYNHDSYELCLFNQDEQDGASITVTRGVQPETMEVYESGTSIATINGMNDDDDDDPGLRFRRK